MRIGYGIFQEQTQKLMMTPELRLAIKILQYSATELAEYIQQELAENPVLDIKEEENVLEEPAAEDKYDIDWQEYFADTSDLGLPTTGREEKEEFYYEHILSKAPTLQEHLNFQLCLTELTDLQRKICEYLIGNIDEAGYLQVGLEEAAFKFGLSCGEVEKALRIIQSFEPYGVGARNLSECLLIQAENLKLLNPVLSQVIEQYLPELARGKLAKIAQEMNVSVQDIQKAFDIIKTLDPKPGRRFSGTNDVRYIVPDLIIERVDGEYVVIINDTAVPRLVINGSYRDILKNETGEAARKFIEEKLNSAAWLIRSIEQRRLTLYKIARCLVELQKDFLDYGVRRLKPLTLKQVAERVGVHESTVSRATANKFAQTPQGLVELKFFFAHGVENSTGGMVSAESIKKQITEMIAHEDEANPLSDQKICDRLNLQGIKISRRTVAKYRDELGIPQASVRKRYE
ncbi:RNA polymerase sigma 54 subunit RpoN [Thermincola ferriacetica]|uniref:RNA polymerase sigma 54 subunit RpoN n=1 Tax=Thermincola ferriacetica TaxID=281456 RepID=A0A0L6W4J4_9FIRM|nr:RNA polymerase factor sigma-54 [Thermincola ferriacetica]KNZ70014.1 RNA polymerase sigma 54 subunit RpoN [Thermincola ferriacetica]